MQIWRWHWLLVQGHEAFGVELTVSTFGILYQTNELDRTNKEEKNENKRWFHLRRRWREAQALLEAVPVSARDADTRSAAARALAVAGEWRRALAVLLNRRKIFYFENY